MRSPTAPGRHRRCRSGRRSAIGGFVASALTWRLVFAAETVVVAILLFGIRRITDAPVAGGDKLDVPGAALSALGLGLVVFGILKSSQWGLIFPTGALTVGGTEITPFGFSVVPFFIAAGVVVLLLFSRWEAHQAREGRSPLLDPDVMRVAQLRSGLSMFVSSYLIMAGTFFVLPLYLQLVLGMRSTRGSRSSRSRWRWCSRPCRALGSPPASHRGR